MIIFYDKRDGQIFGTVDGRVHDDKFLQSAMMTNSNIPDNQIGKYIVPTKAIAVEEEVPVIEQYADPRDNYKIHQKVVGTKKVKKVKELVFDVPFRSLLSKYEDPTDPLQLINCKVVLDKKDEVSDIVEAK